MKRPKAALSRDEGEGPTDKEIIALRLTLPMSIQEITEFSENSVIVRNAAFIKIQKKHQDVFPLLQQFQELVDDWIVLTPDHRYINRWVMFLRESDRWVVAVLGPILKGRGQGATELVTLFAAEDPDLDRKKMGDHRHCLETFG